MVLQRLPQESLGVRTGTDTAFDSPGVAGWPCAGRGSGVTDGCVPASATRSPPPGSSSCCGAEAERTSGWCGPSDWLLLQLELRDREPERAVSRRTGVKRGGGAADAPADGGGEPREPAAVDTSSFGLAESTRASPRPPRVDACAAVKKAGCAGRCVWGIRASDFSTGLTCTGTLIRSRGSGAGSPGGSTALA